MTIDSAYFMERYAVDGDTEYRFLFESIGDVAIDVFHELNGTRTALVEDTDYTLTFDPYRNPIFKSGLVTLIEPLTAGAISIERKTPIVNDFLAEALKPFQPEQFENQIDRYTMILQEIEGGACACPPELYEVPIDIDPGAYVDVDGEIPDVCRPYSCDAFLAHTERNGGGLVFSFTDTEPIVLQPSYSMGNGYSLVPNANFVGDVLLKSPGGAPYWAWRMDVVFPRCTPGQLRYGIATRGNPTSQSGPGFAVASGDPTGVIILHSGGFSTSTSRGTLYRLVIPYSNVIGDGVTVANTELAIEAVYSVSQGVGIFFGGTGAEFQPVWYGTPAFGSVNFMGFSVTYAIYLLPNPGGSGEWKVQYTASLTVTTNNGTFTRTRVRDTNSSNGSAITIGPPTARIMGLLDSRIIAAAGLATADSMDDYYQAYLRNFPEYETPDWCPV